MNQRNKFQMKEQNKIAGKKNEMKWRQLIYQIYRAQNIDYKDAQLTRRISGKLNKNLHNKTETIKKNKSRIKNITTAKKTTLYRNNSRLNEAEDWINDLKDKVVENSKSKQQKKKKRIKRMRTV